LKTDTENSSRGLLGCDAA